MVEENKSAVTEVSEIPEERIDSVLGRASSHSPEATADTPALATDAIEAIAVTEIPAETEQEDPTEMPEKLPVEIPVETLTPVPAASVAAVAAGSAEAGGQTPPVASVASVAIPELPADVGIASGTQFRLDTRYEVEGDAEVFVKTGSMGTTLLRGHILDLSSTGCFIQTMARVMIKPGTVVQLIFSIYGTTFRIDATSRYARMRVGVGFRFLEMDEPTHKRLHAVLGDIRSKLIHENQPVIDRAILE